MSSNVNFIVLNKKNGLVDPAAAAAALIPITVTYTPKLLSESFIVAINNAKAEAKNNPDDDTKANAVKTAIENAINNAVDVTVTALATAEGSVVILIPSIPDNKSIEALANYVKNDNILNSILKDEQNVIFGGKKSKSKKQRKNKANKRKSVRH